MSSLESTLTLPPDDNVINNDPNNPQVDRAQGLGERQDAGIDNPTATNLPLETRPVTYQELLDQSQDMHPDLRVHVERLAAEEEGQRAEITPKHHQEHITVAEPIVPDIESRPEAEQDLIGETIEVGETAIGSADTGGEPALEATPSIGPQIPRAPEAAESEKVTEKQEISGMSPEERQQAASKWVSEHLFEEEAAEDPLSIFETTPTVKLKLSEGEAVPAQFSSEVALELLKDDDYRMVDQFQQNIDKFSNLDEEVVSRILELSYSPTIIFEHPEKFQNLEFNDVLADRLMQQRCGDLVVEHSGEFKGLALDTSLAGKLVESGNAYAVIDNIDKFTGVTLDKQFLDKALEEPRNVFDIASSINKFQGVDADEALARRIVKAGGLSALSDGIGNFHGLSNDLFEELVTESTGRRIDVFKNMEAFPSLNKPEFVRIMTTIAKSGESDMFGVSFLPQELQSTLLQSMIEESDFDPKTLLSYSSLDNAVANKLIASGYVGEFLGSIDSFPDFKLDLPFAEKLLEGAEGNPGLLMANIAKFPPELHESIAEGVIAKGWADQLDSLVEQGDMVVNEALAEKLKTIREAMGGRVNPEGIKAYIEAFPDTDVNVLADRLLTQGEGEGYTEYQIENMDASLKSLSGLDKSIAERLLASGNPDLVVNNLASFAGLDKSIAEALIDAGKTRSVVLNAEVFSNFSITTGQAMELLKNDTEYNGDLLSVLELMDPSLPPSFNNELALKLVEKNGVYYLASFIEQFKDLDSSVAGELALFGNAELVLDNVDRFKDLSQIDLAKIIIGKGMSSVIFRRLSSIEGLEDMDPEGDPLVERFVGLLKDKELIALIGNDGPLNVLSNGFLELYMHSKDPYAVSTQIKALADGNTALWRINHEYAKLLVGEVGDVGYLESYKVDSVPMALPRKDIGETIADLPSPVPFADMDGDMRRLILSQEYIDSHPDIMAESGINFTDLNSEAQDTLLAYRLYESIAATRDSSSQSQASERNRLFAEAGEYWHEGDLAHATGSVANLRQILLSGILCGETIGSASSSDSYPFNVDTVVVSPEVLAAESHEARVHALKNLGYGGLVLLLHRTAESTDFNKELRGGNSEDHRLVFGAVPGTEISAVMLRDAEEGASADVIDSIIEAGVYIPVINQEGENILTYEEYQRRRADGNYVTIQPRILDSSFKREGTQGGSNEGAIFIVPHAGTTESYYVKFGDASALKHDHLWTEILADRVYRAVTPELVPDTEPVVVEGRLAKASKMVEVSEGAEVTDQARNAGFIMDTYLGNWDVVYNAANLVMTTDGRAMRIDTGNSLDFRAQGEHKPDGYFSETVNEVEAGSDRFDLRTGMRQKYPGLTDEMIASQVRELRDRLPDEMIDSLVESIRRPRAERDELARIMKARKQYLIDKFLQG